jgi:Protein of unknown function (DUF998)
MVRKVLLFCGILASLVYVGRDLAALVSYPGYDFANQVISELSAIDLPSRGVDVAVGRAYGMLMLLFSVGIWLSAGERRGVRIAAALLAAATIYGAFWPPMHMRGAPMSLTDTLHIVWTAAWLAFTLAAMAFAAAVLGRRFLYYTVASVVVILLFGALTGLQGARLAENLPTPAIGIYERINIGAYLLWMAVFALALWPRASQTAGDAEAGIVASGELKHA